MAWHYITLLFQLPEKETAGEDCICEVKWAARESEKGTEREMERCILPYRERRKMEKAMLDITPPSMEDIPAVLVDVDVAREQPENAGQAVEDPMPLNEDFSVLHTREE